MPSLNKKWPDAQKDNSGANKSTSFISVVRDPYARSKKMEQFDPPVTTLKS